MGSEQFLWCRNCDAIHHVTQPEKPSIQENPSRAVSETSAETFKNQHAGHKVECLIAAGERYFPTGQKEDPMAVAYIEVTDNHDRYLLRGARKSIEQPLQFAMVKGCLADAGFRLQVQEAALRKAMKRRWSIRAIRRRKDRWLHLISSRGGQRNRSGLGPSERLLHYRQQHCLRAVG